MTELWSVQREQGLTADGKHGVIQHAFGYNDMQLASQERRAAIILDWHGFLLMLLAMRSLRLHSHVRCKGTDVKGNRPVRTYISAFCEFCYLFLPVNPVGNAADQSTVGSPRFRADRSRTDLPLQHISQVSTLVPARLCTIFRDIIIKASPSSIP